MFGRRIPLFRLFGFQVGIDWTWFLLAILITWSLAESAFPLWFKDLSRTAYWTMGVAGALGLFLSIVLHELGHSLVARQHGVEMRGITLFIFGGVAEMTAEPPSAKAELLIAIAGPIVSVIIAGVSLAAGIAGNAVGVPVTVTGVLLYLGGVNALLVAFNMIPAFPLDGGRVLRSILWQVRGSLRWATRVTSQIGSWFGLALIAFGGFVFIMGNFIGGMWWFLIGMFLRGAASMSYQQLLVRRALEGEPVSRFMRAEPVTVPPDISVQDFVEDYVYRHYFKMYPVVRDGDLLGCVTLQQVRNVPRQEWARRSVGEMAQQCTEENMIGASADAMEALSKMNRSGASRLMVAENGRLVGVLALKDLMEFLSAKIDLEKD